MIGSGSEDTLRDGPPADAAVGVEHVADGGRQCGPHDDINAADLRVAGTGKDGFEEFAGRR
jgi:hypothetical protein